jgi:hypothetical protein
MTWALRATTVGVLVGVYQFNTNDIGEYLAPAMLPWVSLPADILVWFAHLNYLSRSHRTDCEGVARLSQVHEYMMEARH